MALPLLPGNSFNRNVGKEKFHKSQHWGFCNNVRMLVSDEKPGMGGELLPGQKIKPKNSVFPKGDGADAPSWAAFDKQVLSFDAYLEDEVPDKRQENYRIRYYKIYFYLEDDTIQVNEPELIKSGLPQGTSIRRHRITLPPPDEDQFYTVYHFNINVDVVFYGRTFKIYDCETFTKNFLKKIGIKLNPSLPRPGDPYMKMRREYGPPGIFQPGQITDRAVLNVYGGLSEWQADGYLLDKYQLGKVEQEFYTDWDLTIGATINVWGRKVLLCDCDEFTKSYYRTKYGIDNFTTISRKPPPPPKIEWKYPPYNGFGSEEDSFRSCVGLKPTPHQRNFKKFMELDSYGNISNTLRYFAKLITDKCADLDRMFVIAFYLSDDTVSVFEPIERNSGNAGGMFLKRGRVKKPGQEVFKSKFSEYIKAEELYIGTTVNVNGYLFFLLNADEYTLKYMENNTDKYPYSNFELAIQKLKQEKSKSREIMQVFSAADYNPTKVLPYNTFREILMSITRGKLIEQEFITISRHYRVPEIMDPDITCLIAQAHEKFKKNMFDNFDVFIYNCVYEDRQKKGVLPTKDIKRMCKSSRLPLSNDLLDSLLSRFEDKEQQINYKVFFSILNWRMNPTPEIQSPPYFKEKCEYLWMGMPSPIPVKYVRYLDFLKDVYGL